VARMGPFGVRGVHIMGLPKPIIPFIFR